MGFLAALWSGIWFYPDRDPGKLALNLLSFLRLCLGLHEIQVHGDLNLHWLWKMFFSSQHVLTL